MQLNEMRLRLKSSLTLFLLLLAFSFSALSEPKKIKLVTDSNYAPFSFVKNNTLQGDVVELIRQVDENLPGYDIELVPMSWKKGLDLVKKGQFLGIVGTYQFGSRRPYLYPYSAALYTEHVVALCRDEFGLQESVSWPHSFKGKLVLNIAGYDGWLGFYPRNDIKTRNINFLEVPNINVAASMLKKGNANCTLSEISYAESIIERAKDNDDYNPLIAANVLSNTVHVGYSVAAWEQDSHGEVIAFAKAFDFALLGLQQDGKVLKP